MSIKNDIIGNQTRDLPAFSAVPQPTAPPRAPILQIYNSKTVYFSLILEYETKAFCGKIDHESANDASLYLNAMETSVALAGYNSAEPCLEELSVCSKILLTVAAYVLQIVNVIECNKVTNNFIHDLCIDRKVTCVLFLPFCTSHSLITQ